MAPYENSLWFIETNLHPLLEIAQGQPDMVNYRRPSFWSRFMELQRVMWETNAGLTARHAYDSRPQTWPVLRRGINYWTKDHRQIYLLGNPFIWYGSLCAIMVFLGARALLMLRAKRGCKDFNDSTIQFYDHTAGFLALGWAMHFLPFFAMHRQLFLHHYLPALYFSILLLAVLFDALTSALRPKFRFLAALGMIAVAFLSYTAYAPITYGSPWTSKACERARLLKTWDLNCHDFPARIEMYSQYGPGIHTIEHSSFNQTLLGSAGATASNLGFMPQAGNHPFEEAPKQAAMSGGSQDAAKLAYATYAADQAHEPALPAPAVPVARPEDAMKGAQDARDQASDERAEQQKVAEQGADIKGLDQEGVEAVVLEGTADKAKPHTFASTSTSDGVSRAAVMNTASEATAEGVHVVADT